MWTIWILVGANHMAGMAEARVDKFWVEVGYVKSHHTDYKSPSTGA